MPSPVASGHFELIAGLRHRLGTAVILVVLFASSLGAFEAVAKRNAFEDIFRQPGGWLGVFLVGAGSAVFHELLHVLGWIAFGNLRWRSVSVRRTLRAMGFVACTSATMSVRAFRISTALPAVILGGGSIATGLSCGYGLSVLWGFFFLVECYSDFTVLLATAGLPPTARIREYTDRIGCEVHYEGEHLPP